MKIDFTFNSEEEAELAAYCIREQSYKLAEKAVDTKEQHFTNISNLAHGISGRLYGAILAQTREPGRKRRLNHTKL